MVTLGTGAFNIMSTKYNIVFKSSTEAEIVGVPDVIGSNLGLMYILEEQGYNVKPYGTINRPLPLWRREDYVLEDQAHSNLIFLNSRQN